MCRRTCKGSLKVGDGERWLHIFATVIVFVRVHVFHIALVRLLLGRAEVPAERKIQGAATTLIELVASEAVAAGEGLKLAGIEHIAAVERYGEFLVEEILAHAEVHVVVALAVTLCDDLAGAQAATQLDGDVVRQDEAGLHTGVPSEVGVALSGDVLVVYHITESVELKVVRIHIGCQVKNAEKLVFQRCFHTRTLALGHILCGRIHDARFWLVPTDALHHIGRRPVVGTDKQRVLGPGTEIVERERIGELGRELGVTEGDGSGIASVAERVELSAPGPAQAAGLVELQLVVVCELIAQEEAGEQLEVVFLERHIAQ